ncbi:MAG: dienelactone hydrolase family protein [Actinomycetota bacterium]
MRDALTDFTSTTETYDGNARAVYTKGEGPGVLVMAEVPGITPSVADFARRVADAGFTAVMPSLFGTDGAPPSTRAINATVFRACISREFTCMAAGKTSPVVSWLRQLAADVHQRCGGDGVGAIGMCFTGGFALAMMVEPAVVAPVLSQPATPFPVSARLRRDLGISPEDLSTITDRVAAEGCAVLGLRFTEDRLVPAERFATLRSVLGDAFVAIEIDSSPGNAHDIPKSAHSVVTQDFVDEPGHPTRQAMDDVLAFFAERLGG